MPGQETIDLLLEEGRACLAAAPHRPPRREAALLLAHVLELDEARLLARGDTPVPDSPAARFRHLLARRVAAEPVAYLLGRREFFGREMAVDSRVLIPRPETEHLVEAALAAELPDEPLVIDIGTGSGCLAVTIACERPRATVIATDLDPGALEIAGANSRRHGVASRVLLVRADLASGLDLERADLVVSNPPYVAIAASSQMSAEVLEFEPHLALFAPEDGRHLLRRLLDHAADLRRHRTLMLEIGHDQGDWIEQAVARRPFLELDELIRDYGGHRRTAVVRRR